MAIAGRFRSRVELFEPQRHVNSFGEEAVEYVTRGTVRAERVRFSGSRSDEVGEHFADYRVTFNIRTKASDVDDSWHLREVGGHLYNVVAVEPNIPRGYKALICERLNE